MTTVENEGFLSLTDWGDRVDWKISNDLGTLKSGTLWGESLALDDEDRDFDFDAVTERIGKLAGLALENNQNWTESSEDRIYWTVTIRDEAQA